jgi:hypothetical protein
MENLSQNSYRPDQYSNGYNSLLSYSLPLSAEESKHISTQLEASPKKLLPLLALSSYGLEKSTAHTDTRLFIHSILPPDCKASIQCCTWFQKSVFNGLFDPEHTVTS